ncbi:flavin reductase family protein [Albirhodobacter sp. R86504]|uniref:flavin reductase family protein n=1 Tax=Albirhodobacter sp. R86504 TaxID=3093848 RepID=UPI00366EF218
MMAQGTTNGSFIPDEGNTRLLRDAFGRFATGVTIVTAAIDGPVIDPATGAPSDAPGAQGGIAAITANSFSSVSLTPPLVLWSPDRNAKRFQYFEQAQHFAIHVLAEDQVDLCWGVARNCFALGDEALTGGILARNQEGVPLIENCLARFECSREAVYEGGDHVIMVGRVLRAFLRETGEPLAFFKGQMRQFAPQ